MDLWMIILIVVALFMGPYLLAIRAITKKATGPTESSEMSKRTAKVVLALDKKVDRLGNEVEELKNHGRGRKT